MDKGELCTLLAIAWSIWFGRNKSVHDNITLNGVMVAAGFSKLIEEYGIYAKKVFFKANPKYYLSAVVWNRPPEVIVKINVDALIANSYVGLGVEARNSEWQLVWVETRRCEARWEVEVEESASVYYGMQVALRMDHDKVWMEDVTVSKHIDERSSGFSPKWLFYDDIGNLSKSFDVFIMSHVKRVGNTVAHLVARRDSRNCSELLCMNSFPQSITTLVELNLK